jgi:diguanylate cyclase (GGDEF)-like protein
MVATPKAKQPVRDPAIGIASPTERWRALFTALALLAFALLAIPFGARPAGESDALIPAVCSASFVAMLVTAAILRNQYRVGRYVPYAFLGIAYACTAFLLLPYTLIFPNVLSPNGFGTAEQAAPWLWVGWHVAFVILIAAYVWAESFFARVASKASKAIRFVRWYAAAVGAVALLWVAAVVLGHERLPVLTERAGYSPFYHSVVEEPLLALVAIVLLTLIVRTRLRHGSQLWLGVVLVALGTEIYVSGTLGRAPFTVAWYICLFLAVVWQGLFLVNQLRHANEQLAAFAAEKGSLIEETLRDPLTGLYNRRGFDERYTKMAADCRRTGDSLALLALDLDYFKAYNDHFGHAMGDDALRAIGKAIASVANLPMDACCRIGGEEFAVVLAMADETSARTVAERIQNAIERLAIRHSGEVATHLTASIGLAVSNGVKPISVRELYERADSALYRAKRLGRNRVAVYEDPGREERRAG